MSSPKTPSSPEKATATEANGPEKASGPEQASKRPRRAVRDPKLISLLGPAFVAAVAYVDPGNVAANITAGARYGYTLVWVLVAANLMAVLVQYQSAKLGLVTGQSLPRILGNRLSKPKRIAFWAQAELVAAATDLAEVIGGAIALNLLFGLPLVWGGVIVGIISMGLLMLQNQHTQHRFELAVIALLFIITIGFLAGLFVDPPNAKETLGGLIPRFAGRDSVLVAASMLGATVMPHAIYLHSTLVNDRHGKSDQSTGRLLQASRWDVTWALLLAGAVNIALLLLAATSLRGVDGTDSIEGAHAAITAHLGPTVGVIFGIGLLASGLASTSVGAYAGSEIMKGLLHIRIPLLVRRLITLIPALIILGAGWDPTWSLVVSQVVLSFGIPAALIPLVHYTADKELMGEYRDSMPLRVASIVSATIICVLNLLLIYLTFTGQG
ncbi:divalent metal cation transporter [Boudabousia liubingyangii]|uniref:Divalent metal cation transporter n=1 Tax=Boudabousia liubingyangii TaxID=1921764 RepID=A0A1Q5PKB7_9ACTO|nr:Nramp family divalent metal transporter [Boudabousia liubingyangii]OKL46666.1 divalent metal cation transporter [Boudabousia liubingyangii]